jgi:predicted hotdog family 3-hydroxylacyl-ACP dehydratase
MLLNHDELCRLIPHHGTMCLLDGVIEWNENEIQCQATSQSAPNNPLQSNGAVGAINGVEYAAQAMAVHGALLAQDSAKPDVAYLAAVRGVQLHCDTLHEEAVLTLHCQRLGGDSNGFIYAFRVLGESSLLLEGRATVIKEKKKESTV